MKRAFQIALLLFITAALYATREPRSALIPFESSLNFRQSYNDCGPFSAKAAINAVKKKNIPIKELKANLKWRLKNNYTLPVGVEGLLKKYGIKVQTINLARSNDDERIAYLKKQLMRGSPIILLIGIGRYQHYITLLGYNSQGFIIYDSLLKASEKSKIHTVDLNGSLPGNNILSRAELLKSWSKGGMYGLYRYYGIVCSSR